ncbi:F-box/kelch-repeat protein At3g06240-like [Coffea arabica]|uniref:F-box/kelch-repeat protein At3g06240-like n=1 Tax=Coffea arabica TaxID=13443 RepID=A0A6P6W4T1_COFAR|nr:F-box/kelch-repeat protein At3g06240-like [Coffea arabica]
MAQEDLPFEVIVTILLLLPADPSHACLQSMVCFDHQCRVHPKSSPDYGFKGTYECAYNFGKNLYLWNPCIRKYKCISSSCIDIKKSNRLGSSLAVGFGYLNQANDYKIVRIVYIEKDDDHFLDEDNDYMDGDDHDDIGGDGNEIIEMEIDEDISASKAESSSNDDRTTEVEVYSLTRDSWRKVEIQSFPWFLCDYFTRAFVNNCVHWMVFYRRVNEDESMILAFDLEKEAFQQITVPHYEDDVAEYVESIVHKEALGFVVIYPQETTELCSLWEMKEYGVVESWSKVFNVEVGGTIYRPFTITKNDQIMFKGENQGLSLYSFQSQEIKTVTVKLDSDELDFLSTVDSLILL